jgi:hypothetical protein
MRGGLSWSEAKALPWAEYMALVKWMKDSRRKG